MNTIALPTTEHTPIPTRVKVAAGLALPLGAMNVVGAVVFWEWSAWTWVAVWAAVMGAATVTGAARTLLGRAGGVRLLRYAIIGQLVFTALKIVGWQEVEATTFGVVALIVAALLRERRSD